MKKLHANQKKELEKAIEKIRDNPTIGEGKTGRLAGILVYKFFMVGQLTLLAYRFDADIDQIKLVAFGSHENFCRNLPFA